MKNTIMSSIYFVAKMYLNELVTSILWLETNGTPDTKGNDTRMQVADQK